MDDNTCRELGNGIWRIDTGLYRPGHAACYLLSSGSEAAFIDTGTGHSVTRLLGLLEDIGLAPEQVRYVIPTHVHLDHGGGAGALMARLPAARLLVHPRGGRHLVDPAQLSAGAMEVYGEEGFNAHFGEVVPVPEDRVVEAQDGMVIELGGRRLEFLDTPGHANHHGCLFDSQTRGFFTGDTFGVCYPELRAGDRALVFAPTTPVAFDPAAWHRSLDRLMSYAPEVMFITHFGPVTDMEGHLARLRRSIDDHQALALREEDAPQEGRLDRLMTGVRELLEGRAREEGLALEPAAVDEVLGGDVMLNAQGLEVWLKRRARAREREAAR